MQFKSVNSDNFDSTKLIVDKQSNMIKYQYNEILNPLVIQTQKIKLIYGLLNKKYFDYQKINFRYKST